MQECKSEKLTEGLEQTTVEHRLSEPTGTTVCSNNQTILKYNTYVGLCSRLSES